MARQLDDWISAYMKHVAGTEAPRLMHFWCAVSAVAGVLRRKVWIDLKRFVWRPNFYIILVAPPGIISKSTTMDMALSLLREVPGIKFGPDVATWQALVGAFAESSELFQYGDDWYPMSALTLASSELGNLIAFDDKAAITMYIDLWDGRQSLEKITKASGSDLVNAPWINMIACTTPHWIADNMPHAVVGGGFTSRCVFVYGEQKENYIAYPDEHVREGFDESRAALIADLVHMSEILVGPYRITEEARAWGRAWYKEMWEAKEKVFVEDSLRGYLARKQTHMHKLAMVLSASRGDSMEIILEDLLIASQKLEETEADLPKVFARIGKSEASNQADRLLDLVKALGKVRYETGLRHVQAFFPDFRDFEGILQGLIRSGQIRLEFHGIPRMVAGKMEQDAMLVYTGGG
jgi:hypothetical protein